MARLRQGSVCAVILALIWLVYVCEGVNAVAQTGLTDTNLIYDRPVLIVDPGMHTDQINEIAIDQRGRLLVTSSSDKTVRIWDAASGVLQQTIHMPNGPDRVGEIYAVAIQPDGSLVAAGGWTDDRDGNFSIYLIDPSRGQIVHRITGMPNVTTRLAFSPDGRYLAAGTVGLRVFDRDKGWAVSRRTTTMAGKSMALVSLWMADWRLPVLTVSSDSTMLTSASGTILG
jgi:WD40 repeat protein